MSNYMNRAWAGLGACAVAGLLGGPGCAAADEDIAYTRQPLLCQSVDVCDDSNPCTDDLCVANLCVHLPLLNCCEACAGGAGGGGAGGEDGGTDTGGGRAGSANAGTGPLAGGGGIGGDRSVGEPNGGVGATMNGGGGVPGSGAVTSSEAGHGAHPDGGTATDTGGTAPSIAEALRLEGGGCAFATRTRGAPGEALPWALLGALLLGRRFPDRSRRTATGNQ